MGRPSWLPELESTRASREFASILANDPSASLAGVRP